MALRPNHFYFLGTLMYRGSIFSPVYPAAWLLFGMAFSLAMAHFFSFTWSKIATAIFYLVPFVWVSLIIWHRRGIQLGIGRIDILFALFILVVLVSSSAMHGGFTETTRKYILYMPFMMVIPYLCGRLMRIPDIAGLLRVTMVAGLAMLPLLLLDRFTSPGRDSGRWPFFGLDHGALLAGSLLAMALVALCVSTLGFPNPSERNNRRLRAIQYCLIGLMTAFLVWLTARGFLLSSLVGVAVTCLSARQHAIWRRVGLLAAVLTIVGLSLSVLPKVDPFFLRMSAAPMDISSPTESVPGATGPILGEASCQPFKEGSNSVAMRWVLYREATAIFMEHPYLGVGAVRFGEHSCTGPGGYPHSTILQGFAELGLVGGGLLVGLLSLAAITLWRQFLTAGQGSIWSANAFALALFAMFFVADQIYGNYFMSVGTFLMLGIAASMRAHDKQGVSRG